MLRAALGLALASLAGCTCAASHERDSGVDPPDAPVATDAGRPRGCADPSVVGPVAPWPTPTSDRCDAETERACRTTLQAFVPSGFARSSCLFGECTRGDRCRFDVSTPFCDCDGARCAPDEICASDTPTGPARCVPFCLPLERSPDAPCNPASRTMSTFETVMRGRPCDENAEVACGLYATGLLPYGHHAYGQCYTAPSGDSYCGDGSRACTPPPEPPGPPICSCGLATCAGDERCGEIPDGPLTCYPICAPDDPRP